jgi:hypothetical protein
MSRRDWIASRDETMVLKQIRLLVTTKTLTGKEKKKKTFTSICLFFSSNKYDFLLIQDKKHDI